MSSIPSAFLANSWEWESGEGVDEYFKAKGTPWVFRKLILSGSHVVTWKDLGDANFSVINKALVTLNFEFRLGEEFTAKGYDKRERKVLITCDGNSIMERYQQTDKPEEPVEIYTYIIDGEKMIQKMGRAGISCKRVFQKVNK